MVGLDPSTLVDVLPAAALVVAADGSVRGANERARALFAFDEVVLPRVNETQARAIADSIVEGIRQATAGLVGASYGVAHYTAQMRSTTESLIDLADNAMYEAKRLTKGEAA